MDNRLGETGMSGTSPVAQFAPRQQGLSAVEVLGHAYGLANQAREMFNAGQRVFALSLLQSARVAIEAAGPALDSMAKDISSIEEAALRMGTTESTPTQTQPRAAAGANRKGRAKGWKMSEEAKAKISAAAKARKRDKFGHLIAGKKSTKKPAKTRKVSKKASQKKK